MLYLNRSTMVRERVQTVVQGHYGTIYAVATHPTLAAFATAADDNTMRCACERVTQGPILSSKIFVQFQMFITLLDQKLRTF